MLFAVFLVFQICRLDWDTQEFSLTGEEFHIHAEYIAAVSDEPHRTAAQRLREHLAIYEAKRDLVSLGAYKKGSDAKLDDALRRIDAIEGFLRQGVDERSSFDDTVAQLGALVK